MIIYSHDERFWYAVLGETSLIGYGDTKEKALESLNSCWNSLEEALLKQGSTVKEWLFANSRDFAPSVDEGKVVPNER